MSLWKSFLWAVVTLIGFAAALTGTALGVTYLQSATPTVQYCVGGALLVGIFTGIIYISSNHKDSNIW